MQQTLDETDKTGISQTSNLYTGRCTLWSRAGYGAMQEYGWKYIFSQKETRQRLVAENYNLLSEEDKTKKTGIKIGKEEGTGCYYNHMEKLAGKKS